MHEKKKHDIRWFFACGKPWLQKWWIYIIIVFVVSMFIIIPFLINSAYMNGRSLPEPNTYFTAGDWLSFYGTILGALATIIVLVITLTHNRQIIQLNMKEQRIREKHKEEKQIAEDILDVILLRKYGDALFADDKSLLLFLQDINAVYFETLARVPLDAGDQSNKAKFYRGVYQIHEQYMKELNSVEAAVPTNIEEAKSAHAAMSAVKSSIVHIKNEHQTNLWFLEKGLLFSINEEMNKEIDKLYGIKEVTTNDKT